MSAPEKPAAGDPGGDELEVLVHRLTRMLGGMGAPASHVTAAVCFLIGIQGRHGGRCTLAQAQAVACNWIDKGWKAYDRWSVVDMPKELGSGDADSGSDGLLEEP